MTPQFAVVRKAKSPYAFSQFHMTFDQAKAEAERLCRKEQVPFMVVTVVATVEPVTVPVQWQFTEPFGTLIGQSE